MIIQNFFYSTQKYHSVFVISLITFKLFIRNLLFRLNQAILNTDSMFYLYFILFLYMNILILPIEHLPIICYFNEFI